jgi:acyl-CoA thioesterase
LSDYLKQLQDKTNNCPYGSSLGFKVVEVRPGYARVVATVQPQHDSWIGRTHGGWLMSLADHASSIVGNTIPGNYVATQFNIHFISTPDVGDRVEAEGRVLHQGKTLGLVEMKVTGSNGKLLAYATGNVLSIGDRAPRDNSRAAD